MVWQCDACATDGVRVNNENLDHECWRCREPRNKAREAWDYQPLSMHITYSGEPEQPQSDVIYDPNVKPGMSRAALQATVFAVSYTVGIWALGVMVGHWWWK